MTTIPPAPESVVPGHGIFRVLYGSWAHGTNTPTSDTDWRGVFQLPNDAFLGLDYPKTTHEVKASDEVYWEVGHFCRLLLKGNPNIVGMLFAPSDCIDTVGPEFQPLIDNRERFLSSAMVAAYMGWVRRELVEIAKLHKGHAKRLSHVPRLLWEVESAMERGRIEVRPSPSKIERIVAIKTGTMPYEEAEAWIGGLLLDVERVEERAGTLPPPPTDWTRGYLLQVRERFGR